MSVVEVFGQFGCFDGLVCNVVIVNLCNMLLEVLSFGEWIWILVVNLIGLMLLVKYCMFYLCVYNGVIVNIVLICVYQLEFDFEVYVVSKGGLLVLIYVLVVSLGLDICVNVFSFGWIDICEVVECEVVLLIELDYDQYLVGWVGMVEDVVLLVVWLFFEDVGFVIGQEFLVDGGMIWKMIYFD